MKTSKRQTIPDPIPLARNALIGSLMTAAAATVVAGYEISEAIAGQKWQLYLLASSTVLLLGMALWSIWINRRGNPTLGMSGLFLITPAIFLIHTVAADNLGTALSFGILGVAITGAPIVLPHKYYPRILFFGVLSTFAILIADRMHFPFRVNTFEPLSDTILLAGGAIVVMNLVMLVYQFRIHPLRNKIILTVTVLTAIAATLVAVVSLNSTRLALHQTANQTLFTAASQTASNLEYFLTSTLEAIDTEAQLPALRAYLLTPAEQRTHDQENELGQILNTFKSKEVRVYATETTRYAFIQSYSLIDMEGRVIFDTNQANIGQDWSEQDFFRSTIASAKPYVSSVEFSDSNQAWLHFGARVLYETRPVGALVVRYNALILQRIIAENKNLQELAGPNSFAILLDENSLHLAHGQNSELPVYLFQTASLLDPQLERDLQALGRLPRRTDISANIPELVEGLAGATESPSFQFTDPQEEIYFGSAVRLTTEPWWVVYVQPEKSLLSAVEEQLSSIQLVAVILTGLTALIAIMLTGILAAPITRLTRYTELVIAGDIDVRAIPETSDEVGELAVAFNAMTEQLQSMIANLERRVEERTVELQQRSAYLEASTTVSQAIASILETEQLIKRAVDLIRDRFELYYVGLFIVDEALEFANLRAGTGEAGQRMLTRGHRLPIDERSMIGWCITHAEARIALQAGEDPVRLSTSELPETRSEAAIPLRSRGRVVGAITVQSNQVNAFDQDMIAVLQVMADQVAIALDNARLFADSQAALEATRRVYGDVSRKAWQDLSINQPDLGFVSAEGSLRHANDIWLPEMDLAVSRGESIIGHQSANENGNADGGITSNRSSLTVPIKVRGNVVGVLDTYKPGTDSFWTPEEIATIESITEQLSVALDSARLYSETQLQAERERLVAEITTHMRETLDVETVLKTAAQEIYEALGLQDVVIRLENPDQA